jgi:hydrogenase maturation protein HypF
LDYYPLSGGDRASKEAVRPIMGLMKKYKLSIPQEILNEIEPDREKRAAIEQQIEKNINTVPTSSLGRLFDAVSALCGLGNYNHFEGQLPMAMEAEAVFDVSDYYSFDIIPDGKNILIGTKPIIESVIEDIKRGVDRGIISARFHNAVVRFLLTMAEKAREQSGLTTAAISGGVFCNKFISQKLIELLKKNSFKVLFNQLVPTNDGGVSPGQAAIAAKATEKR